QQRTQRLGCQCWKVAVVADGAEARDRVVKYLCVVDPEGGVEAAGRCRGWESRNTELLQALEPHLLHGIVMRMEDEAAVVEKKVKEAQASVGAVAARKERVAEFRDRAVALNEASEL